MLVKDMESLSNSSVYSGHCHGYIVTLTFNDVATSFNNDYLPLAILPDNYLATLMVAPLAEAASR